jgi:hypothetical protein
VDCPAFESAIDALQAYGVVDVKDGAAGECVVTLLHGPNDDIKTSLWVDVARGFTIRREEVRARNLSTGEWTGIVALTETAWEEWSGVWVPASFLLERHFNGDETYSLSLDWSSVNEQIEDVVFVTEGLGVERGTPILDERRGGKPVLLGRVGGEIKAIEELPAVDRSGLNQWRIVLMNCGLVVLLALVVVVGRRGARSDPLSPILKAGLRKIGRGFRETRRRRGTCDKLAESRHSRNRSQPRKGDRHRFPGNCSPVPLDRIGRRLKKRGKIEPVPEP